MYNNKRLPKGIHIVVADDKSASKVGGTPLTEEPHAPWGYIFIQHISHHSRQPDASVHEDNVRRARKSHVPARSIREVCKDHVKLRVLTGVLRGQEGYVVRILRDRQLVMEFGGYAVAISNVHREDFEIAEQD